MRKASRFRLAAAVSIAAIAFSPAASVARDHGFDVRDGHHDVHRHHGDGVSDSRSTSVADGRDHRRHGERRRHRFHHRRFGHSVARYVEYDHDRDHDVLPEVRSPLIPDRVPILPSKRNRFDRDAIPIVTVIVGSDPDRDDRSLAERFGSGGSARIVHVDERTMNDACEMSHGVCIIRP
ncbi:hypothetical protein [Pararhizobium mangrovi]|uniref:Uncharacterized protein n=1 Tax=Pararhizobium mangrovi TaxID=2590452 RepID=A0A506U1Y5_9HYPH|nr:hypothetical protein [Pararhizobium mangrovi]TPW27044.1 hypothetical protein FJU11_12950 [Pararhizobium mangrovi]